MMRLTISTGNKRFSAKMDDAEGDKLFFDFVLQIMGDPEPDARDDPEFAPNEDGTTLPENPVKCPDAEGKEDPPEVIIPVEKIPFAADFAEKAAETVSRKVFEAMHKVPVSVFSSERQGDAKEYTGFLYIRCPHCGNEHGFCAKVPTSLSNCRECGTPVALKNLRKVIFECKCGRNYRYFTNITDSMFDINCLNCGAPNTVDFIPKLNCYKGIDRDRT